ncbi:MAG: M3 family oligoendopeptidase [Anaerolineaceae bacterium]|nr:M3 family oligoendopeptidase [Anaerolineaceae bacterium]
MINPPFQQKRWSLQDLFPALDSPAVNTAFEQADKLVAKFETRRGELTEDISVEAFLSVIHDLEEIMELRNKVCGYAQMKFTEDTQDQAATALVARSDQFAAEIENRSLFFSLWWKELAESHAKVLLENSGDLRYWLEAMRKFKPHTLTEPEEKIVNIKNVTGARSVVTLYNAITNRYVYKVEVDGAVKELTRGGVMAQVRKPDANLRARAYQELYRIFGDDGAILGQMYQTLVRDWRNEQVDLRHFKKPISARNLVNDLPDEVVDTLLDVAGENTAVFQRFFKLKAKRIGMEKLRRYDIYAPITKSDKKYPFAEAADKVLDSFNQFETRFGNLARQVFAEDHMDSEVRKGKQDGAYCETLSPRITPWVKLNYQGEAEDVATMAHELGHAIHSLLANQHSLFTQHSCLPLAETASTFGEMMLVDRLLAEESDVDVQRDLLFRQVDGAYATIQRQSFFAMFEKQAHDMVIQGASVDDLAGAYFDNLKLQFGDAVEIGDEFHWEWVSIPHIYAVPFYVYAYAFGQLLVFSLYRQYKLEGDSFKPRYIQMLSTGGSKAPMQILDEVGVDVRQPAFWQSGYDVLRELVDRLETL